MLAVLAGPAHAATPRILPEFTHTGSADWINSPPLTAAQLRGKVVLVEFWAFDCINCVRSAPWIKSIASRYARAGLVVIGVHTPELSQEKVADNVRAAAKRLEITYPVMIDADYSFWNAMDNRYWPAFYVIGVNGRVRAQSFGELHIGESSALQLEGIIKQLLQAATDPPASAAEGSVPRIQSP